jgi:hypothetical protein
MFDGGDEEDESVPDDESFASVDDLEGFYRDCGI